MDDTGRVLAGLSSRELSGALLASAVTHLLLLIPTLVTLQIYDRVLSSYSVETLVMLLVAAALALAAWSLVETSRVRWHAAKACGVAQGLERQLTPSLLRAPTDRMSGIAAQLWGDIGAIRAFAGGPLQLAVIDLPWSLVYLAVLPAFHPLLGAVALLAILLLISLAWLTELRVRRATHSAQQGQLEAQIRLGEVASFAEVAQAHGQHAQIAMALGSIQDRASRLHLNAEMPIHSLKTAGKLLRQVLQLAMLAVGAWLVIRGQATAGVMIAGSILLGKALMPFEILIGGWKQILYSRSAAKRLRRLLVAVQAASREPETALPPSRGARRASGLAMRRGQGGPDILRNLSFDLPSGAQLAVLGNSGSGKSTLAKVLAGVLAPTRGEIALDGAALHQYRSKDRGNSTGYLPQEVLLHSGTIAHNIARLWQPTEPMTVQESQAVVEAAHRGGAHEMITALPKGYDTLLGDGPGGTVLSGGQRQRIALARALYAAPGSSGPSLVVLDEPNSQLDTEGEVALEHCMRALREAGKTVVVITHRPHIIALATHVLVLRQGEVERFGLREHVRQWMVQRNQRAMRQEVTAA